MKYLKIILIVFVFLEILKKKKKKTAMRKKPMKMTSVKRPPPPPPDPRFEKKNHINQLINKIWPNYDVAVLSKKM